MTYKTFQDELFNNLNSEIIAVIIAHRPSRSELANIFAQHELWTQDNTKGARADLSGADLSNLSLEDINLFGFNLERTNFEKANLYDAELRETNMTGASLKGVSARWAYLSRSDLTDADLGDACFSHADFADANMTDINLDGTDLSWAIGNGREILTVLMDEYHINITDEVIWVNDCSHTWNEWMAFNDDEIDDQDINPKWWNESKIKLSAIIEERKRQREPGTQGDDSKVPIF